MTIPRSIKLFTLPFLFLALSYWTAVSAAQSQNKDAQKQQDPATLKIETELVQIDVVVTDKQGKLVKDLKSEDFQILEDGKAQTVTHFSVGTATRQANWIRTEPKAANKNSAAATPVPNTTTVPPTRVDSVGRYLVMAVDDIHLKPGNLMQAKQTLTKFIDQQIGINDQVAFVTTGGQIGMFEQFTTNRDALRRAVNRLSANNKTVTSNSDIPRITPYQAELIEDGDPDALELAVQELIARLSMDRRMATSQAQGQARMIVQENRSLTISTLSTLENIIRDLRGLPGRKVMVLLSDGFLLGGQRNGAHFDLRRITDAATRAGVVIYSLDARGLIAMPDSMDASSPSFFGTGALAASRMRIENSALEADRDGLNALAEDTGGKAIFNNNDLNLGLQQVLDDTDSYYLLAFEPTTSYRDGRFRKLEIKLPGHPELKIRTRKGYFAPDDKAAEKIERNLAKAAEQDKKKSPEKLAEEAKAATTKLVVSGLSSLFQRREVPVETAVTFLNSPEGVQTDIFAHIEATTLKLKTIGDRQTGKLELVGIVYKEDGKVEKDFVDTLSLNLKPASYEAAIKGGITYNKRLNLPPGFYQLRFVARDDGGAQIGTSSNWFEIPDLNKKQLTLSSIFFPPPEQVDAMDNTAKASDKPELRSSERPTIVYRRFKSGSTMDFMIFAYNGKANDKGATDLAIQTQIYSGKKLILATPVKNFLTDSEHGPSTQSHPQSPTQTGQVYLARLSLDKFELGEYELRLVVVDRNAKSSAQRTINFTVE